MFLAIQTAGPTTILELLSADGERLERDEWESIRELADGLLSRLTALLERHDATFHNLTGIILFAGPGSFTSLRIGHSVANALGDSLKIPVASAGTEDWIRLALAGLTHATIGQALKAGLWG